MDNDSEKYIWVLLAWCLEFKNFGKLNVEYWQRLLWFTAPTHNTDTNTQSPRKSISQTQRLLKEPNWNQKCWRDREKREREDPKLRLEKSGRMLNLKKKKNKTIRSPLTSYHLLFRGMARLLEQNMHSLKKTFETKFHILWSIWTPMLLSIRESKLHSIWHKGP